MNNNWPDENRSRIKLEHLYYRAWSRMRFFNARYMKGTIVIESLPGLWMCRGRHSLREWTQKHTLREYANFLHLKVIGDCYISLFHLWWSKKTEALSLWCLLWLIALVSWMSVCCLVFGSTRKSTLWSSEPSLFWNSENLHPSKWLPY